MPISGNNSAISGADVRAEVAAGRLEWASSDPGTTTLPNNKCLTRTRYNTYIKNDGGLANAAKLINYGDAIAHADFTPAGPVHSLSLDYPGVSQKGQMDAALPGNSSGNQYSHECWFKREAATDEQVLMSRLTTGDEGWELIWKSSTSTLYMRFRDQVQGIDDRNTALALALNTWVHVSVQPVVGASAVAHTVITNGANTATVTPAFGIPNVGQIWHLGESRAGSTVQFNGKIDDIRLYSATRNAAAIAADFQSDTPGANIAYRWRLESYSTVGSDKVFAPDTGAGVNFLGQSFSDSTDTPF